MLPEKEEFIKEVTFKTSRSGGKGGQHVNKVSTRVALIFNPAASAFFTEEEKLRLTARLAGKLDSAGNLQVICQDSRSQFANKERALEKALALLENALRERKARKATKVPKTMIEKRLMNKFVLSLKKEGRKRPRANDD